MSGSDLRDRQQQAATVGFDELDQYQRQLCESSGHNVRVLAPPGSGKTQTLLWRCRRLQENARHSSSRFLVVTFTVAARAELARRLATPEFQPLSGSVTISTLNGWSWSRLLASVDKARGEPALVTRRQDRARCVDQMVEDLRSDHPALTALSRVGRSRAAGLVVHVDTLKNLGFGVGRRDGSKVDFLAHCATLDREGLGVRIDELIADLQKLRILSDPTRAALDNLLGVSAPGDDSAFEPREELYERFVPFANELFRSMYRRNRFTWDDQKYVALLSLERETGMPTQSERLSHVLVDEFQDISPLDLALVRAIADWHRAGLTIVGDDDQAIFEWRGASPSYLLEPEKKFGRSFETHVLSRNYRSPKNLARAANRLIQHNERRHPKRICAVSDVNAEIVLLESADGAGVVTRVMGEVRNFLKSRGPRDRMALLSRKQAQLVPYQILFADKGIDFQAADDLAIFLSRAFASLVRMIGIRARRDRNESADEVVADTIHLCRHVAAGTPQRGEIKRLERELGHRKPASYREACGLVQELQGGFDLGLDSRRGSHDYAGPVFELLRAETVSDTVAVIAGRFEGLSQDFGRGATDIFYKDPPFFFLESVAKRFGSDFASFLETLERAKASARSQEGEEKPAKRASQRGDEPIELATALRAKGKEFHTVAILDAREKVWPSALAETDIALEAERRLFYVAMTRARRKLILAWSRHDVEAKEVAPSRYLAESGLSSPTKSLLCGGTDVDPVGAATAGESDRPPMPKGVELKRRGSQTQTGTVRTARTPLATRDRSQKDSSLAAVVGRGWSDRQDDRPAGSETLDEGRLMARSIRLTDGKWGAWVQGDYERSSLVGRELVVRTRSGKSWKARITSVVWRGSSRNGRGAIVRCAVPGSGSSTGPPEKRPTARPVSDAQREEASFYSNDEIDLDAIEEWLSSLESQRWLDRQSDYEADYESDFDAAREQGNALWDD